MRMQRVSEVMMSQGLTATPSTAVSDLAMERKAGPTTASRRITGAIHMVIHPFLFPIHWRMLIRNGVFPGWRERLGIGKMRRNMRGALRAIETYLIRVNV